MNILNNAFLRTLNDKQDFEAHTLILDYSQITNAKGTEYIRATLSSNDGTVSAMVWKGSAYNTLSGSDLKGSIVSIEGRVNDYNGSRGIVITSVNEADDDIEDTDFVQMHYDMDYMKSQYEEFLSRNVSKEGLEVVELLLVGPIKDSFTSEFAARAAGKNHDNVYGGLLAHSVKCALILESVWGHYPHLQKRVDKDCIFIGTLLHDMGKTIEYENGAMSELGKLVSHRTIAVESLSRKKKAVIQLKGAEFYYRLMSIFAQHHGEYEEKPRTVEAMIVHFVDNLEASMASLGQNMEKVAPGETEYIHGFHIS